MKFIAKILLAIFVGIVLIAFIRDLNLTDGERAEIAKGNQERGNALNLRNKQVTQDCIATVQGIGEAVQSGRLVLLDYKAVGEAQRSSARVAEAANKGDWSTAAYYCDSALDGLREAVR